MEKQILVVCGIVLLMFCVDVARCQDCSEAALQTRQRQCFTDASINIGSNTDPTDLQSIYFNAAASVCQLTEPFKTAIRCVVADGKRCLVSLGVDPNLITSADQMIDAISYICNNANSIDPDCISGSTSSLTDCITNKAQGLTEQDAQDTKKIICLGFDWSLECFQGSGLSQCDAKTKEVMVEYTRIIRPPACGASFLGMSSALLLLGYLLSAVFSK